MQTLWLSDDVHDWDRALSSYDSVIAAQKVAGLVEHDRWYREELAGTLSERDPAHVTLDELVRVTRWKMARGVWRARNLALVRANDEEGVRETSRAALARIPDPREPISRLSRLAGVGPATASAVAAAAAPEVYPFLDELVAAQVPGLGKPAFTIGYYAMYADALRERARQLGYGWTPVQVERALWSNAGGKAGVRAGTRRPYQNTPGASASVLQPRLESASLSTLTPASAALH
jgi:hypothetical protein